MKELTIKEKAKRYDEAIEKARIWKDKSGMPKDKQGILDDIFPELAESDDEKIRKALIEMVHDTTGDSLWVDYDVHKEDALAWLEKQSEHANFRNKIQIGDKVTRNRDGVLVNLSQLNRVAKKDEKQGEQKPAGNVEPKFKKGDRVIGIISGMQYYITEVCNDYYYTESGCIIMFCAQDNFNLYEQKPAWSEEDEDRLNSCVDAINAVYKWDSMIAWLKSLKDRVLPQPKQEWSEEDENTRKKIIKFLKEQNYFDGKANEFKEPYKKEYEWLKSLRPQSQWKPSDLPHWKKSTLPNDNTTGFNSDYFCYKGYNINYKELFEKLPKDD